MMIYTPDQINNTKHILDKTYVTLYGMCVLSHNLQHYPDMGKYKNPDTAKFGGISVNRSKIVDLQGCHPRVVGDLPLKQSWIPTFVGMTIVN